MEYEKDLKDQTCNINRHTLLITIAIPWFPPHSKYEERNNLKEEGNEERFWGLRIQTFVFVYGVSSPPISPLGEVALSLPYVLLLMFARCTKRTNASTTSDIGGLNSGSVC